METKLWREINVADHGIRPDSGLDALKPLNELLRSLEPLNRIRIIFPKGTYEFKDQQAMEDFDSLMSGHLSPSLWEIDYKTPYNIAVRCEQFHEVEFAGNGSLFLYHGLIEAFSLWNSSNITFRDIEIDYARKPFSVGTIIRTDKHKVYLEFPEHFPMKGGEPISAAQNIDSTTGLLGRFNPYRNMGNLELVGHQQAIIHRYGERVKVGDQLVIRHLFWYRPAIHLMNCNNIRFENVTIRSSLWSAILAHRSSELYFHQVTVAPRAEMKMSVPGDAIHLISCSGTVEFDQCYMEGMGDDGLNVHSFYYDVIEKIDDKTIIGTIGVASQDMKMDYPDPGDMIEWVDRKSLYPQAYGKVAESVVDQDQWKVRITFEAAIPAECLEHQYLLSNASKAAKLIFRRSTVRNNRARGLLIQTRDVLVEDNTFENCTGSAIHINCAINDWRESMSTRDVIIRNNRMLNCGHGPGTYKGACGVSVMAECDEEAVGLHRNITIENNEIVGRPEAIGIYVGNTEGYTIKSNQIRECSVAVKVKASNKGIFRNNDFSDGEIQIVN